MLSNIKIGKYFNINSNIHDMNPLIKLIVVFIILIMTLIANDIFVHIMVLIISLIFVLSSEVPLENYYKPIFKLKWFMLFIVIINLLAGTTIINTVFMIIKLVSIILISNVLLYTTKINDMTRALEQFFKPLKIFKIPVSELALIISLALRFIPNILNQFNRINKSMMSKKMDFDGSDFKTKVKLVRIMIMPMIVNSLKISDTLSDSLELKFYEVGKKRSEYKEEYYTLYDIFILLFYLSLLVIMIIKGGRL